MPSSRLCFLALVAVLPSAPARPQTHTKAAELRIQLSGQKEIVRNRVRYTCDANAARLGLPSGAFTVEYIRAGNNGLAIVPVAGERILFAQVLSGSGERFAAGFNEWGDKGNDAWLESEQVGPDGKNPVTYCHERP